MRCSYYCNGYCFWHGDTGEVCDKMEFGTHRKIKDGYCPKEQSDRELEEHANAIIAEEEKKRRERFLFRGKDKDDGKWYEGAYRVFEDTTYCFKEDYDRHPENTHHTIIFSQMTDWGLPNRHLQAEVIPETVGQYTGLQDKNGKKIFEGDIVKVVRSNNGYSPYSQIRTVQYNANTASYDFYDYSGDIDSVEVLGNIHDNPELLRKL